MTESPRIILLIDTSRLFGRGLISGIVRYCRINKPWMFYCEPEISPQKNIAPLLKNWGAHGAILVSTFYEAMYEVVKDIPCIAVADDTPIGECPNVIGNWKKTGTMAADYLMEKNLKHFAYSNWQDKFWSAKRCEAFREHLNKAGFEAHAFNHSFSRFLEPWPEILGELTAWLRSLPKPVGIFACNDDNARQVLEACKIAQFRVPEDVAVLGVDNDQTVCELTTPPLSSISVNTEKAGFEAAQLLDKMMTHSEESYRDCQVVIEPQLVITRQSTETLACENKDVVEAIRYIRMKADRPIQVADVAKHTALPLRSLQRHFIRYLGYTLFDAILHYRVMKVCDLLLNSSMSIYEISNKLGFSNPSHMSRSFKLIKQMSPSEFRKQQTHPRGFIRSR